MIKVKPASRKQKIAAAKAWAEFLYAEYCLEKALQNQPKGRIIKDATNHDKLNS